MVENFGGSAQNVVNLCLSSCFDKLFPKFKLCTKLLASMAAEVGVPNFFGRWDYSLIQTLPLLFPKVAFGRVNPNSCCVPNLKSLASVVAIKSRGSPQNFGVLPKPSPC